MKLKNFQRRAKALRALYQRNSKMAADIYKDKILMIGGGRLAYRGVRASTRFYTDLYWGNVMTAQRKYISYSNRVVKDVLALVNASQTDSNE